ncbi:MAG: YggT family protein [Clostridia bacterium]|nr:YggT family protein [Clostridia bacterium]
MWLIVGRGIFSFFLSSKKVGQNFIINLFVGITEPVFKLVKKILPFIGDDWLPLTSFILIVMLRLLLLPLMAAVN